MFPLATMRQDSAVVSEPLGVLVTERPNVSLVPGSPKSCTVTVKVQFSGFVAGPQLPQKLIDPSVFVDMLVTGPLTC
jgi:hypothetical protein